MKAKVFSLVFVLVLLAGLVPAARVPVAEAAAATPVAGPAEVVLAAPASLSATIGSPYKDADSPTGWMVKVTIRNNRSEPARVGAAAYEVTDGTIDHQILRDYKVVDLEAGGTFEIDLVLPCWAQVDAFEGEVLHSLDGQRYGDRLIAARWYEVDCSSPQKPACLSASGSPSEGKVPYDYAITDVKVYDRDNQIIRYEVAWWDGTMERTVDPVGLVKSVTVTGTHTIAIGLVTRDYGTLYYDECRMETVATEEPSTPTPTPTPTVTPVPGVRCVGCRAEDTELEAGETTTIHVEGSEHAVEWRLWQEGVPEPVAGGSGNRGQYEYVADGEPGVVAFDAEVRGSNGWDGGENGDCHIEITVGQPPVTPTPTPEIQVYNEQQETSPGAQIRIREGLSGEARKDFDREQAEAHGPTQDVGYDPAVPHWPPHDPANITLFLYKVDTRPPDHDLFTLNSERIEGVHRYAAGSLLEAGAWRRDDPPASARQGGVWLDQEGDRGSIGATHEGIQGHPFSRKGWGAQTWVIWEPVEIPEPDENDYVLDHLATSRHFLTRYLTWWGFYSAKDIEPEWAELGITNGLEDDRLNRIDPETGKVVGGYSANLAQLVYPGPVLHYTGFEGVSGIKFMWAAEPEGLWPWMYDENGDRILSDADFYAVLEAMPWPEWDGENAVVREDECVALEVLVAKMLVKYNDTHQLADKYLEYVPPEYAAEVYGSSG